MSVNLNWKLDARLSARRFTDSDSKLAFRAGYSDGFYNYEREAGDWPFQPYSAGYWKGAHDHAHSDVP